MSKAFRMYLLHPDDDLSCSGSARVRKVAPFQNTSLVFEQGAQRVCTQITTRAAHAHDLEAELIQVDGWDSSSDSENGSAVEGSEEHFDESEHVIVRRSAVRARAVGGATCAVEETYTAE